MPARHFTAAIAAAIVALGSPVRAEQLYVTPVMNYIVTKVMPWINDPVIIEAVKAQNLKHANMNAQDIDKLDRQWMQEIDAPEKPLIDSVLTTPASLFLQHKQAASAGAIVEIFVMDNKGLNVAEGDATSDYWQGDEDKFQKTYDVADDALFIDEPEWDDEAKIWRNQVSFTLTDAAKTKIGAVTVEINLTELQRRQSPAT